MYFIKTPRFFQKLFPKLTWKIPTVDKKLYLTFDDGPIPQITPWVLRQLAKYDAKATFFMVGENAANYPHLYHKVKEDGHAIGSHSYNHLSGWITENSTYYRNVAKCARQLSTKLYRPPYGRMRPKQANHLSGLYRIVMWDVLSGDFDTDISPKQCLQNVLDHAEAGSIIVFHDNIKAKERLYYALPKVLKHYTDLGYRFEVLQESVIQKTKLKSA